MIQKHQFPARFSSFSLQTFCAFVLNKTYMEFFPCMQESRILNLYRNPTLRY